MPNIHHISPDPITYEVLKSLLNTDCQLALSEDSRSAIANCRSYLDEKMENPDELIYGINTGFGSLCNIKISPDQIEQLQENLVMSHACGVGAQVPDIISRLILLLKIQSLSYGHSGVSVATVERLIAFFNKGILPVIYDEGSLGASGDLAPLAHMSLPILGMGEVMYQGKKQPTSEVLNQVGMFPQKLQSKEGLALLNGTQFMGAYGVFNVVNGKRLNNLADLIATFSLDAWLCLDEPFNPLIQKLRNQPGQLTTAENILNYWKDSEILNEHKHQVQDPYSFRCIPQVHGASRDALNHVENVFLNEINSVTDNPNVFAKEDLVLSGGNFHGQPLALALDYMSMAIAELGSISERRVYRMLSGSRGLPEFLIEDTGLNSGLMIPQYTAASLVSKNKQLCTPSSVDSVPSSNEQEDHVSMGANGAVKCYQVVKNVEKILAIEFMTACQALDFRKPLKSSPMVNSIFNDYREVVSFNNKDRVLYDDIQKTIEYINAIRFPLT